MADITTTYLIRIRKEGAEQTIAAIKNLVVEVQKFERSQKSLVDTSKKQADTFVDLAGKTSKLALRAALVVPIWQGIRAVFTSTIGTFQDTIKSFIDLDRSIQLVKNELTDLDSSVEVLSRVREEAIKLSKELGIAPAQASESFRFFKSAGLDVEEALGGMNVALKGSVATGEDAKDTTNSLITVYTLMKDRITGATTAQEKFESILGRIFALMPSEVFTLGEFNDALKNFAGTANTSNLALNEMIALIATSATLSQKGARAGSQLSSAFRELLQERGKISQFLGRDIDAGGKIDEFQVLSEVLLKVRSQLQSGQSSDFIDKTFGAKGGVVIKSQLADLDRLFTEIDKLNGLSLADFQNEIKKRLENSLDSVAKQMDRLKNIRESLGRNFLAGLFNIQNADDPVKFLKNINDALEKMETTAKVTGRAIQDLLLLLTAFGALKFAGNIGKGLKLGETAGVAGALGGPLPSGVISQGAIKGQIPGALKSAPFGATGVIFATLLGATVLDLMKKQVETLKKAPIFGRLLFSPAGLGVAIGLAIRGIIDFQADKIREKAREDDLASQVEFDQFLKENLKNRQSKGLKPTPGNQFTTTLEPGSDEEKLAQAVLKNRLEILKAQGALNSQLIKAEGSYKTQLNLYDSQLDRALRLVEAEKARTEEKRLQNRIGSTSQKLFEIAQEQGVPVAKIVGELLSGQRNLSTFFKQIDSIKGSLNTSDFEKELIAAADAFKDKFNDIFQGKQAEEFFKGNIIPGFQELQGGTGVPIEEKLVGNTSALTNLTQVIIENTKALRVLNPEPSNNLIPGTRNSKPVDNSRFDEKSFNRISNLISGSSNQPVLNNKNLDSFLDQKKVLNNRQLLDEIRRIDEKRSGDKSILRNDTVVPDVNQTNTITNTFNINGTADPKETAEMTLSLWRTAITTPGSPENKALAQTLGGVDNTTI